MTIKLASLAEEKQKEMLSMLGILFLKELEGCPCISTRIMFMHSVLDAIYSWQVTSISMEKSWEKQRLMSCIESSSRS